MCKKLKARVADAVMWLSSLEDDRVRDAESDNENKCKTATLVTALNVCIPQLVSLNQSGSNILYGTEARVVGDLKRAYGTYVETHRGSSATRDERKRTAEKLAYCISEAAETFHRLACEDQ